MTLGELSMKKILIVDDEPTIRFAIMMVLGEKGFETLEADNGDSALELATTERPDVIISDVMMDNLNGFLLAELLQKEERTSSIPIILMTGAAQAAGAWDTDPDVQYLQKPFSADVLLNAVERATSYVVPSGNSIS